MQLKQAPAAYGAHSTLTDVAWRIAVAASESSTRACAEPAESISRVEGDENGEPAGQERVATGQNGLSEPTSKRHRQGRGKRRKRAPLADLLGRDVVLDGSLFSTPGTTYAARIMKKVRRTALSSTWRVADACKFVHATEDICSLAFCVSTGPHTQRRRHHSLRGGSISDLAAGG